MEKKIVLTEKEIEVIKKELKGEIGFGSDLETVNIMNGLIEKATALEEELDALDERMQEPDCNLMSWYYKKYLSQQD